MDQTYLTPLKKIIERRIQGAIQYQDKWNGFAKAAIDNVSGNNLYGRLKRIGHIGNES
jgi:hypothetical protein